MSVRVEIEMFVFVFVLKGEGQKEVCIPTYRPACINYGLSGPPWSLERDAQAGFHKHPGI